jgi:DNA sulfur modification protein DndC
VGRELLNKKYLKLYFHKGITMSSLSCVSKESKIYEIFDQTIKKAGEVTIAYSGGKDSTTLAILFLRWLKIRKISGLRIILLHNDTLSEIEPMEYWARAFMQIFKRLASDFGNDVEIKIDRPPIIDTFYWRVIIRGYPAPTWNFRWCVKLLKTNPTSKTIGGLVNNYVLTGVRETESHERAKNVRQKYGGCPLGPSKCLAYYFLKFNDGQTKKIAPLRDWTNADVWEFLRSVKDVDISDLLYLYGCEEARYGCWHCTLATVQWGLHVLDERYLYWDAVRLLYRRISDIPSLRFRKTTGYSRLGALNACARSILLYLMRSSEQLSGVKLYGLDESCYRGYSLREILYEIDASEVENIITEADPKLDPGRRVPISDIRNISKYRNVIPKICKRLESASVNDKSRRIAIRKGLDPVTSLLAELLNEVRCSTL